MAGASTNSGSSSSGGERSASCSTLEPLARKTCRPTYTAESGRLLVAFPLASCQAAGKGFTWSATTTYAGADMDRCPGNGQVRFAA